MFEVKSFISKYKRRLLKTAISHAFSRNPKSYKALFLDYPVSPVPRYGFGHEPHRRLTSILNQNRQKYKDLLGDFSKFETTIEQIPYEMVDRVDPFWNNGFFPALDALALYCIIALTKPARYLEIGSGNSTKFARKSIRDNKISTKIICIDPKPRAEIKGIADEIIYSPLESIDLSIFSMLETNDILFIDGSHRCFMNSDVTTVFLDIIPELARGIKIHFHDIFIPYDYPPEIKECFYSEQYLLAVMLLSQYKSNVLFPGFFIQNDKELMYILDPITMKLNHTSFHGASFWICN